MVDHFRKLARERQLWAESVAQLEAAGAAEGWALRMHTLMCRLCARCVRQLAFLREACARVEEKSAALAAARLSNAARERILERVAGER